MPSSRESGSQRRHWLCVAYAFPPINRSGTHRTLAFVRRLADLGWDATVLTVEPRGESLDESLLHEVPETTRVIRVPWVDPVERLEALGWLGWYKPAKPQTVGFKPCGPLDSRCVAGTPCDRPDPMAVTATPSGSATFARTCAWLSRLAVTPDSRLGWIIPAVRRGLDVVRRRRPDVIYSTSPYMSAHLIALTLSRLTRLPWVADFRDPWRGNPFRELGFPSLERWDSLLEWAALKSATRIVCNTPTMTKQLCRRRPFVADKCTTILNGFDRERFYRLEPKRIVPASDFVLTHCGQFYGPRNPKVWFAALRLLRDQSPVLAKQIHMMLIGPETLAGTPLADLAAEAGVGRQVHVLGEKTHGEALSYATGSDALMLAGSAGFGSHLQVPNKLFEYLAIRKPIIATCTATSPIRSILRDARAEALVCHPGDRAMLTAEIARLAASRRLDVEDPWSGVDQFDRVHRVAELVELFQRVSRTGVAAVPHVLKQRSASIPASCVWPDKLEPGEQAATTPGAAWSATTQRTFG